MLPTVAAALLLAAAPDLAVSSGFEGAWGEAYTGIPLASVADGSVPLGVDFGVRFADRWTVGAYGRLAWLVKRPQVMSPADADVPAAYDQAPQQRLHVRAGAIARFHLTPGDLFDPSVGLGVGYEWLTESSLKGFEASLHLGADYRLRQVFFVGGELVGSVGQFDANLGVRGTSTRPDAISMTFRGGVHGWAGVLLHVRLAF